MPLVCAASSASANVGGEVDELFDPQRPGADAVLQRLAVEQLHHDEALTLVFADVEEHADVRVIERRGDARLAREPGERLRIVRQMRRQQLERHLPAEPAILGAIDHAHAAPAELLDDLVVRERLANHVRETRIIPCRRCMLRPHVETP